MLLKTQGTGCYSGVFDGLKVLLYSSQFRNAQRAFASDTLPFQGGLTVLHWSSQQWAVYHLLGGSQCLTKKSLAIFTES